MQASRIGRPTASPAPLSRIGTGIATEAERGEHEKARQFEAMRTARYEGHVFMAGIGKDRGHREGENRSVGRGDAPICGQKPKAQTA